MNVFTYKYFTSKDKSEQNSQSEVVNKINANSFTDSITSLKERLFEVNEFSLEQNDRAQNYLFEGSKIDNITVFSEKVSQALLAFNDATEGNKYTDQPKMGNQKYIINKVKLLNHRWIIANYSNGSLWGEVLLKYFVEKNGTISFEIMNSYLYPASLN